MGTFDTILSNMKDYHLPITVGIFGVGSLLQRFGHMDGTFVAFTATVLGALTGHAFSPSPKRPAERTLISYNVRTEMDLSPEELKRAMANKTDDELYDVLHAHSTDYTADAVEAARQEFSSRNVDAATLNSISTAAEVQLQREEAPLEWSRRITAFFISTIFFGIPVILAHRHYVEQGARRKAREWARWGLFGFLLYFALSILAALARYRRPS